MYKNVMIYILNQYKILCQAHRIEVMKYKGQLKGNGQFLLLEFFLDKQSHLKSLLKKISQNSVVQESFQELLIDSGVISRDQLNDSQFLADQLLLNLLDQLWI